MTAESLRPPTESLGAAVSHNAPLCEPPYGSRGLQHRDTSQALGGKPRARASLDIIEDYVSSVGRLRSHEWRRDTLPHPPRRDTSGPAGPWPSHGASLR